MWSFSLAKDPDVDMFKKSDSNEIDTIYDVAVAAAIYPPSDVIASTHA